MDVCKVKGWKVSMVNDDSYSEEELIQDLENRRNNLINEYQQVTEKLTKLKENFIREQFPFKNGKYYRLSNCKEDDLIYESKPYFKYFKFVDSEAHPFEIESTKQKFVTITNVLNHNWTCREEKLFPEQNLEFKTKDYICLNDLHLMDYREIDQEKFECILSKFKTYLDAKRIRELN